MNPLDEYPAVRKALYKIQWTLNGIATVLGAYFVAAQIAPEDLPRWYVIGLAVLPVLWTYLGVTADRNVDSSPPAPED